MQRVRDWLQIDPSHLESPPESPCYDFPMKEEEEDKNWGLPDEESEDSIPIVNYEPFAEKSNMQ